MEVCNNNQWGTVCDDLWGTTDANVACRQLGFSSTGTYCHCTLHLLLDLFYQMSQMCFHLLGFSPSSLGATPLSFAFFGQGTGPILLDNVGCTGSETRLWDCPNNGVGVHNCAHFEDASVRCRSKYACMRIFVAHLQYQVYDKIGHLYIKHIFSSQHDCHYKPFLQWQITLHFGLQYVSVDNCTVFDVLDSYYPIWDLE